MVSRVFNPSNSMSFILFFLRTVTVVDLLEVGTFKSN